ncbi:MAG: hydrolase [Pseudomonadota bacterium]
MADLSIKTRDDEAICEHIEALEANMQDQTFDWAKTNTGSWNRAGLDSLAPRLGDAFSALDANIELIDTDPFEKISDKGTVEAFETGPVIRISSRPDAASQIIMSGHYDTVFPPETFTEIREIEDDKYNGPGLADMKGGISVMLGALQAFEAGPLKDKLGYQIIITPDEETGNFASAPFLTKAAQSGAMIGMTYEPCMDTGAMSGGRKGSAVFDIVLHGRSAHAGRAKEEGRSALEAAAAMVVSLEALNGKFEGVTFNVGSIDGGSAVNIVPDMAIVRFGARAPDSEAAAWATARVDELLKVAQARDGISGHVHGGFYRPPKPRNDAQQALFDAVADTGRAIGLELEFVDTGGVCEGNNIFAAGVPNVDTLGVMGGRIHSDEEYVIMSSFVERAQLSGLLLNRIADGRLDAAKIKAMMG